MLVKVPANLRKPVKCDASHDCPAGTTCCKLSTGDWGCCPFPQAVCCSDGEHCCPHATTCNLQNQTCDQGDLSIGWFDKISTQAAVSKPVKCDASHDCPAGTTCCKLSTGDWGCCPFPQAVCCSDGEHCCPHATTCNLQNQTCDQGGLSVRWFDKIKAQESVAKPVKCDASHDCPADTTCCKLSTGDWGCCPLPQAVCCSDGEHCCPHATTCNLQNQTCDQGVLSVRWFTKLPARATVISKPVKCDASHDCPAGTTCCKLSTGDWGCCPFPQAVCCSDGEHCCPHATTCNLQNQTCDQGDLSVRWFDKMSAQATISKPVKCDASHDCPTGTTCCKLSTGDWGCCPFPQAVCCSDGEHCCPHATTCNLQNQTCDQGDLSVRWFDKIRAQETVAKPVKCDASHDCPAGTTCCKLSTGDWGCCPFPQAVCCSDGEHCCPHATTCNLQNQTCDQGDFSVRWFDKMSAQATVSKPVKCDASYDCPAGTTCCKLSTGEWGCCPFPQAVCCSDGEHCCPHATTCNLQNQTCDQGDLTVRWFDKISAQETISKPVKCDASHDCPAGTTCCKLSTGDWGCCPFPQAVCCSDGEHCCPHATTCNLQNQTCDQGDSSIRWFDKIGAQATVTKPVKCDASHDCPADTTCCKLSTGDWGCCPLPQAVCCSDGEHCCPHATTCNLQNQTCDQGALSLPWHGKQPARRQPSAEQTSGESAASASSGGDCASDPCPKGNTCCTMESGQWSCCPLQNAVCCSDHIHCCPEGGSCDVEGGRCTFGHTVAEWQASEPRSRMPVNGTHQGDKPTWVMCDYEYECPDGSTCCLLKSGEWGCCPLPLATCCDDGVHCCPNGYRCDVATQQCIQANGGERRVRPSEPFAAIKRAQP